MKYYTDTDGNICAFYKDGYTEIDSPIREDGTLLPNHKNLSTLEVDSSGNYYKYYNKDCTPDHSKIELELTTQNHIKKITNAKQYLADTDWYVTRYSETGKAIPDEVSNQREIARSTIKGNK